MLDRRAHVSDELIDRHPVGQVLIFRDIPDARELTGAMRRESVPSTIAFPERWPQQVQQHLDRGCLARSVGPTNAKRLPAGT